MTVMDFTGVCVLSYATVCAVWILCEAATEALRAPARTPERPSSLPPRRW